MIRILVATPLVLVLLDACSDHRGSAGRFARVVNVTRAQYDSAPSLGLERLGSLCAIASGECAMTDVRAAVASAAHGALVAFTDGPVQHYDTAGRWVGAIGSPGAQSGQYRDPAALDVDDAGNVQVYDIGSLTLLRFDTTGTLTSSHRLPVPVGLQDLVGPPQLGPRGMMYFEAPGGSTLGSPVDGVFILAAPAATTAKRQVTVRARAQSVKGARFQPPRPFFMARPAWALDRSGGIVFTNGDSAAVARYDAKGQPDLLVRIDRPAVDVTPADIDIELRRQLTLFSNDVWRARARPHLERAAHAATTHPAITALRVLDDGSIWLRTSSRVGSDSIRWNVLESDGALAGSVTTRLGSTVVGGRRSRVLIATGKSGSWVNAEWYRVLTPGTGTARLTGQALRPSRVSAH